MGASYLIKQPTGFNTMTEREKMIADAQDLELKFPGNISNIKLKALLAEAQGLPVPDTSAAPAGPAVKAEPEESIKDININAKETHREALRSTALQRRKYVKEQKIASFKKQIVTITNKDPRDNNVTTTAYLSFENQYFGMARMVPLDIPVELEVALIKIAAACTMTLHKDEVIGGKRTGNKTPVRVKKYAISYSQKQPD